MTASSRKGELHMGALDGRVAFITGAARGQGRAHAVRLAQEGADIIAVDICADIPSIDYPNAAPEDLDETVALVEKQERRIVARQADVRDFQALDSAFRAGLSELGRVDIVIANAGVIRLGAEEDPLNEWRDIIDVNLTGVWHTVRVALPAMIEGGRGGSIVMTSSTAGLRSTGTDKASPQAYAAAKRGLVGLMQTLAIDLAKHWIRVNTIHPTGVATGMVLNPAMAQLMASNDPGLAAMQNALPIEMLQPEDIANAVAWLVSDDAKFVTGVALPLDAGFALL
jgi:SDR family mycofactocin-dependent oxidoreductase